MHTDLGDIKIEIFCDSVLKTAEVLLPHPCCDSWLRNQNFLALCASSAYDGSPVHRLIPGFMFQTGSPAGASAKTSTSIWEEPFEDEIKPALRHNARGIVSMANKGPSTNGSQFFVCFAPAPHLDGKNTVFGRVIDGTGVLNKIEEMEIDGKSRPKQSISIRNVTIHANPMAG